MSNTEGRVVLRGNSLESLSPGISRECSSEQATDPLPYFKSLSRHELRTWRDFRFCLPLLTATRFVTIDRFLSAGFDSDDGVKVGRHSLPRRGSASINLNEPVSIADDRWRDLRRHC